MEVIGVCRAATAAVELRKTLLTLLLGIHVTTFEFVTNILSYDAFLHISHQERFISDKLMAGIQVPPGGNCQILCSGTTAGQTLRHTGTTLQVNHKVEEIERLSILLLLQHCLSQSVILLL